MYIRSVYNNIRIKKELYFNQTALLFGGLIILRRNKVILLAQTLSTVCQKNKTYFVSEFSSTLIVKTVFH